MSSLTRRRFVELSGSSLLLGDASAGGQQRPAAKLEDRGGTVRAEGSRYAFQWSSSQDLFQLFDQRGRVVTRGRLSPAVVVSPATGGAPRCQAGKMASYSAAGNALEVRYEALNSGAKLRLRLRFDDQGIWMEPLVYHSAAAEDIVSVYYFADSTDGQPRPAMRSSYWVLPGYSESSGLGPLVQAEMGLNSYLWLGYGGPGQRPRPIQQWGLPAHFFCGFHRNASLGRASALTSSLSDSFCCGLTTLPSGDLMVDLRGGNISPVVEYRSDLWHHMRGPGTLTLGAEWYITTGPNYRDAIRNYYLDLVAAGIVQRKKNSERKNATVVTPQFNTWGAQVAQGKAGSRYNEADVRDMHRAMKECGMKAGMFVLDDKWEDQYGLLQHSAERYPHFNDMIGEFRNEGMEFGLWAAFLRCEQPARFGLGKEHLVRKNDGEPYRTGSYSLFDFTQEKPRQMIRETAHRFMERYRPDLVKFDFGYEIPGLSLAAPGDMNFAGERLLRKSVEVVVDAMREVNPDIAIMYYSLSPLFADYFDLHSPDDLFLCEGEFDLEANRRYFFSSLLGELGIPTYGSGGYDWGTMPEIWFDSAPMGTLGSLVSFTGDPQDQKPSPELVAKFNGLAQALRPTTLFRVEAVEAAYLGPARAARSASWARWEQEKLTMVALRDRTWDGHKTGSCYKAVVNSTASVVVASKTDDDLAHASRLAIVPYGDGELTLTRGARARSVTATEHLFGGQSSPVRVRLENHILRVPLREKAGNGTAVEWVEVTLA